MSDGVTLRGWEVNPGRDRVLVYFGGNAESIQDQREDLARHLPHHTTYLIAYRGYGASERRPTQKALTRDAVAVLDHVQARAASSVDVLGRSLGSGVAVQAAVRRPVGRLVLVTPFDSVAGVAQDLLPRLPVQHLLADRWDSVAVAHRLQARILVVRAGRDDVVRPALTDRLLAALPGRPEVLDLPEAGHSDLADDPAYWTTIAAFLG
jgi:pimeloyl-ACP methyl ester carboxylesterase